MLKKEETGQRARRLAKDSSEFRTQTSLFPLATVAAGVG